jgi:hypothetical protein
MRAVVKYILLIPLILAGCMKTPQENSSQHDRWEDMRSQVGSCWRIGGIPRVTWNQNTRPQEPEEVTCQFESK